jgi:hypothetical protein
MNERTTARYPNAALIWVVALAGTTLVGATAQAQTALGDGRALDANTGQGGRFNAARPSFSQELQFRNAIVTGNAPGGLSFRGDLGYRAAGEFIGDIGSDELFSFRRDSLYSGLAGMGIRGTDALQYQFSLTTGARPPQNIMGDLSIARGAETRTSAAFGSSSAIGRNPSDLDTRGLGLYLPSVQQYELSDAMTGSMRSASSYISTTNLSPVIISTFEQGFGRDRFGLTSSVLTGVTTTPMRSGPPDARRPDGWQPNDRQSDGRQSNDSQPGDRRPGQPESRVDTRVYTADMSGRPAVAGQRGLTAYDEVVERLRVRAAAQAERMRGVDQPERVPSVSDRLDAIRNSMMGTTPTPPGAANPNQAPAQSFGQPDGVPADQRSGPSGTRAPGVNAAPAMGVTNPSTPPPGVSAPSSAPGRTNTGQTVPGMINPGATNPNPMPARADVDDRDQPALRPGARFEIDPDTLELIRVDPTPLASFVDPSADGRDIYSEHMRTGERLIAAERYFDAEERFARALSMRPGDPTAQVGRAHAQLGAGLLLSASVNLRSLFVVHPELLGARYAGRLLPAPERIDTLIERLRFRSGVAPIEGVPLEAGGARIAAAVLLAYLGHQNNRPEVIREGIGVMEEIGAEEDQRLANILRQVWLVGQTAPAADETRPAGVDPATGDPRDGG